MYNPFNFVNIPYKRCDLTNMQLGDLYAHIKLGIIFLNIRIAVFRSEFLYYFFNFVVIRSCYRLHTLIPGSENKSYHATYFK
jgi:hypothetical protein